MMDYRRCRTLEGKVRMAGAPATTWSADQKQRSSRIRCAPRGRERRYAICLEQAPGGGGRVSVSVNIVPVWVVEATPTAVAAVPGSMGRPHFGRAHRPRKGRVRKSVESQRDLHVNRLNLAAGEFVELKAVF